MTPTESSNGVIRLTVAQAIVKWLMAQWIVIDGNETRICGGGFGIFGHGNVTCLSEALEQVQDQLPTWRGQNEQSMALAAVERKFEIIGEGLGQLAKADASMAARIPDLPQIVAFRNQLIHGYATVNVSTVWNITQNAMPVLLAAVHSLLDEFP